MHTLKQVLLATLMLIGFSSLTNASCGFDGNNKGGISVNSCIQQELLSNGKKISERVGIYSFIVKYGKKNGIQKLRKYPDIYSREIDNISHDDIKEIKFNVYAMEMHLNQLSIEEIEKRAGYFSFQSVLLDEDLYFK